jgi:lipopolysaccharide export system protein LptA
MIRLLCLSLMLTTSVLAQQPQGSPFAGFSDNPDKPINFEADKAEVFDTEKKAILTGNVKVVQGESTILTKRLVMFYKDANQQGAAKPATSGISGANGVSRFEMEGGVTVKSKNQAATADRGVYDAKSDLAELFGNVVLIQCSNILKGDKLVVKLKTNQATLTSGNSGGGRVSGLLVQNKPGGGEGCGDPEKPAPKKPAGKL